MSSETFYWFDYETYGLDPAWDRPAQFAGLRTTLELEPLGEPQVLYSRLSGDYLPDPGACAVTGMNPFDINQQGVAEAEFIEQVVAELGAPGTCSLGYNTIGFDDHFTRHTLFRNLLDPYEYEWRNGNSRWDLLDIVRLTRALRPEGIEWPVRDDGGASNKLEHLSAANGIAHEHAHDALSDVYATLGMARLIRTRQPKLFDYAFHHRGKQAVANLLGEGKELVWVSGRVAASRSHLAIVKPFLLDPVDNKRHWLFDLACHPEALLACNDDELLKASNGLRAIRTNQCPVVVPRKVLRPEDAERLGIDTDQITEHAAALPALDNAAFKERVQTALMQENARETTDIDGSLYSGRFFSDSDKKKLHGFLARVRQGDLSPPHEPFDDSRLPEMIWRYRARNWPEALDVDEQAQWREACRDRLLDADAPWRDFATFLHSLDAFPWREEHQSLRGELRRYAEMLANETGASSEFPELET